jgi:hypothetical protein
VETEACQFLLLVVVVVAVEAAMIFEVGPMCWQLCSLL